VSVCVGSIRSGTIGDLVASLQLQTLEDFELIIVGQGSDTTVRDCVAKLAATHPRVRYVHTPQKGLSHARNVGIANARADIIAMTDDDCEVDPNWLKVLVECFEADPRVGLVGGDLVSPPRPAALFAECPKLSVKDTLYDPSNGNRVVPDGWDFVGANFAFRKHVVEQVGVFDEMLGAGAPFPAGEETDFKLRLERAGVAMRATPRAVVHHVHGYRVGLKVIVRQSLAYSRGNGALAAKLHMMGLPQGQEWLERNRAYRLGNWRRPHRFAMDLILLREYRRGFEDCLRDYELDASGVNLRLKGAKHSEVA
jgi:GT2 family glycosyltransferase